MGPSSKSRISVGRRESKFGLMCTFKVNIVCCHTTSFVRLRCLFVVFLKGSDEHTRPTTDFRCGSEGVKDFPILWRYRSWKPGLIKQHQQTNHKLSKKYKFYCNSNKCIILNITQGFQLAKESVHNVYDTEQVGANIHITCHNLGPESMHWNKKHDQLFFVQTYIWW